MCSVLFVFLNWTRTNDKLLQICIIANLGETVRSNGGSKPSPYDQYLFHLLTTLFPLYNSPKICIHFYR